LIVLILGVKVILSKKTSIQEDKIINNVSTYISDYFSAFLLELFNLQTFFMFIFLFTSFKIIPKETTNIELMKFYFNVFLGTNLWWSLIVFFAVTFRSKLKLQDLQWLNKIIGSLIILFGLVLLTNLLIIKYKTPIHNQ
jgi:threonine/homoserine/homoserine lactone efflux protein